jgi:hypothetical protein
MIEKRILVIDGKTVILELRQCACQGCEATFWTTEKSNQSICSKACWEAVFFKPFFKVSLPKKKYPAGS